MTEERRCGSRAADAPMTWSPALSRGTAQEKGPQRQWSRSRGATASGWSTISHSPHDEPPATGLEPSPACPTVLTVPTVASSGEGTVMCTAFLEAAWEGHRARSQAGHSGALQLWANHFSKGLEPEKPPCKFGDNHVRRSTSKETWKGFPQQTVRGVKGAEQCPGHDFPHTP